MSPDLLDILASWLPFLGGLVCGTFIASLTKWGLSRFALELDYRISDLEARVSREVKVRAQANSVKSRKENQSLDDWAAENRPDPVGIQNPVGGFNLFGNAKLEHKKG